MPATRTCPKCGAELPGDALDGLCPKCVAELAFATAPAPKTTIVFSLPLNEKPGDKIGRYKLIQEIGTGGMGTVWMAEQEEPVRRRVALKVIKLGMDTRQVIGRFEAERQALALMDHPNIAKVLDAGATDTGRPFFVMELVRGIPITGYCDKHTLSSRARLELFDQVCQAVQHAHQKGIIHRDIKPSNILVTLNDGVPVPKVIDFGIAKATTGQRLTDKTVFTAFEQFIGTAPYMSPEQAEMSALDIDTRSDIYSLGVLLYELLTDKTPFDTKRLLEAGVDEIRRIIRDEDPPRPSTRLSSLDPGEQTTVAKRRHSDPPKLIRLIRGDLDWIVMRCLEKDRTRRYDTATGLAHDIQRHLNSEPVEARPPSNLYRFQKLVRRNKVAFAATGTVAIALVLALAISDRFFAQEDRRSALADWWQRSQEMLKLASREEEKMIGQTRQLLLAVAESSQVRSGNGRDCKKYLDDLFASYPRYANVGVINTNGDFLASALKPAEPANQADRQFFRRVLKTRTFTIGDFPVERAIGKPTVNFGCPVFDPSGQIQAVVFAALDLDWFSRFESEFLAQLPKEATWTKIDQKGTILVRYPAPEKWIGQPFSEKSLVKIVFGEPQGVVEAKDSDGVGSFYAFASMRSQLVPGEVVTMLSIPKQVLFAGPDRKVARNRALLAIAASLAFALGLALGGLGNRFSARSK